MSEKHKQDPPVLKRDMNNFIATNSQTEEILGKFVYYSLGNILVEKEKFCEIG